MNNAREMADDCLNVLHITKDRGGPGFNDWERNFVESVATQIEGGKTLTDTQYDKLESLWNRI